MNTPTLYIQYASGAYAPADPSFIIAEAKRRIALKFSRGAMLTSPATAKEVIQLQLVTEESEVFACLFLDNRHRVIQFEKLFRGTIDSAKVHPRVVVKRALAHNAAAVMLAHNHPSGVAEPSHSDRQITQQLKQALELIDVRVLDNFVVGDEEVYSFAEHGLL